MNEKTNRPTPDQICEGGLTGRGSALVTPNELKAALEHFRERNLFVHSMESTIIRGEKEVADFRFAIVGLDRERNWENHYDVRVADALVQERIEAAQRYSEPVMFRVWLDDIPSTKPAG